MVTLFEDQEGTPWVNLHETRQRRQLRVETCTPWTRPGYWLRIEFKEPIQGPLIFGDSCHFGLGLFVPARH
jgi:CRISPR-associated protein Csb2